MNLRSSIKALFIVALGAISAAAHPLGNFSVNQFARIEIRHAGIRVRQVLDIAEIPTVAELLSVDSDGDGRYSATELAEYADRISAAFVADIDLEIDGQRMPLKTMSVTAELRPGAGGLSILRVVWDLTADEPAGVTAGRLTYSNQNYADRIGWNEIVVAAGPGVTVYDSTAYGSGVSDELLNYPADSLTSPLAERSAELSFASGAAPPVNSKPLQDRDGAATVPVGADRLGALISVPVITPVTALLGLLIAFGLGAVHAMSPGHGKAIVGTYLVGSKGTARHAVLLGLTVTITHTLGVFALGLVTLFASRYVLPERLMPFLGFVSGLLVFFIGISLFKDRLFTLLGRRPVTGHVHADHGHDGGDLEHTHADGLTHSHGGVVHTHAIPNGLTIKNLVALGISGGLLPCPSALVLMLSAISLGRSGYGLVLTIAFSFGLAATLTSVGLMFLYIGKAVGQTRFSNSRVFRALPVMSSFVVALAGAVICYTSL